MLNAKCGSNAVLQQSLATITTTTTVFYRRHVKGLRFYHLIYHSKFVFSSINADKLIRKTTIFMTINEPQFLFLYKFSFLVERESNKSQ